MINLLKSGDKGDKNSTLKILYEESSHIFIIIEILCLAPYLEGAIQPRSYFSVLLILIINFICIGKNYLTL